ncbi:MAG: DUF2029 domain-containing protein [Rhodospirillaceae bacterium]|jgi:alpha-1,2-mannosyltransferase|nr:DUF2029 domain-containing protein [Rhodospirillaceae bacterium]
MRKLFIITSIAGALLYGGIFAFWGHDWDLSDPLLFILAFPTGKDFINLYAAGQVYAQELSLDIVFNSDSYAAFLTKLFKTEMTPYYYVWSYPPTMLLPARLFAGMPYLPAFSLWSIVTLAIYLGGLRLAGLRGWWLVAALLLPAAAVNLFFGQYGFLLAGLLIGGLSQADRRPLLAGVLLGMATLKPQLGLLLPVLLLAQRQWYVMAVAALMALLLVGVSIALDGMAVWRYYFELTLPVQRMFLETGIGFFMLLTLTPFMAGKLLGLPVALIYALQFAVTLLCALGVYRIGRRGPPLTAMVFTLAAGFLATPYAMAYDLVILAGAGLLLLAAQPKWVKTWPRAVACVLLWILPLWGLSLNLYLMPVAPLVIALFAWQVYSSVNLEPSENRNPRPDPPA